MTGITLDEPTEALDEVVEGRGWRRTTPAKGGRYYEDTAPTCELAEATEQRFSSLTHTLRTCFPTDFTGPTKWNVAKAAVNQQVEWRSLPDAEAVRWLVDQADVSLNQAADRGSAIHRAIEARLLGLPIDLDDVTRNGARDYVPAIEAFLRDADPQPDLVEAVAFGRSTETACTLDFLGSLTIDGTRLEHCVTDWKSRTKNHDRRTKEAAQLGGIIDMAAGGYYMDDRGHRRQAEIRNAGIVTFTPDGTWAWHPVDPKVAVGAWWTALEMRHYTLVSNVYGKAHRGAVLDVAAVAAERLANIPDGPERSTLAQLWTSHGLPKVADLTLEHWVTVDQLLTAAEPFPESKRPDVTFCTNEQVAELAARLRALPPDLRDGVLRAGGGLPALDSVVLTTEDAEDWERLVTPAESTAQGRRLEIDLILGQLDESEAA